MSARTRRLAGFSIAALIALAACEKQPATAPPPPPGGGGSSLVQSVFPAPRSVRVADSTPIWAQFAADLDTSTVDTTHVFFKLDTRRLPIAVAWEPATRRIRITPTDRLALFRTYTVELSGALKTTSGAILGANYVWQFTSSSVRKPESPLPMDGASGESPFVALRWGGLTEAGAGTIRYEVHSGPDSVTAVDPSSAAAGTVAIGQMLPRAAWSQADPVYWAVHVINQTTGERFIGPAWRFATLPATTPIDSTIIDFSDWTHIFSNTPNTRVCQVDSFVMAPNAISVMRWRLALNDSTIRLAGAKIEFSPRYASVTAEVGPTIWYALNTWVACTGVTYPGPPSTDETQGKLAEAFLLPSHRIRFDTPALTAHIEATMRIGGVFGYLFRAPKRMSFWGPSNGFGPEASHLTLYRYRPGPAAAAARR